MLKHVISQAVVVDFEPMLFRDFSELTCIIFRDCLNNLYLQDTKIKSISSLFVVINTVDSNHLKSHRRIFNIYSFSSNRMTI